MKNRTNENLGTVNPKRYGKMRQASSILRPEIRHVKKLKITASQDDDEEYCTKIDYELICREERNT